MQFAGGVRPSDLISQNGGHGPEWEMAARIVTQAIEKAVSSTHFSPALVNIAYTFIGSTDQCRQHTVSNCFSGYRGRIIHLSKKGCEGTFFL